MFPFSFAACRRGRSVDGGGEAAITLPGYQARKAQNPSIEGTRAGSDPDIRLVSSAAEFDPVTEILIEDGRARRAARLGNRELWATVATGGGFLVIALPLALTLDSSTTLAPLVVAALVGAYALAYNVDFEVGPGLAVATQLVFVPMLFLLPLGFVPLCVAAGVMLGNVLELVGGKIRLERILGRLGEAVYSLGPVLVLIAAGEPAPGEAGALVLLAALGAQFGADFLNAATHARIALGISPRAFVRDLAVAWSVDAALAPVGLLAALAAVQYDGAFLLVLPLVGLLRTFARERRSRVDHALELSHAYRGTALLLGDVVEADDAYTGSHSRDVVSLSIAVAVELGLDARSRRDTEFVALLHDVGKIRIPNEIINKPGPLTPEERAIVETHTVVGEEMLDRVGGVLGNVGHLVRSCHERYDGGGYPDGLAGDEIPLVARVVCACDAYNAMTTDRPYRQGRSSEEALAELRRCAGTQFDPVVVAALERVEAAAG
jgi:HD-GYP domain-containing protein (c-di-GMP phosphodiesterase class II)